MTHGRDGFSLARRTALMVARASRTLVVAAAAAGIALLAVVGVGHAGPIDELVVTNSNFPLQGSINVFAPGGGKNAKPTTVISGGPLFPGLNATQLLSGIDINPVSGALYVTQDLGLLAPGLDLVSIFAPNATGASGPIGTIFSTETAVLSLPQDVAFVKGGEGAGDFVVSNLTAGLSEDTGVGSVIQYPSIAGTSGWDGNPVGVLLNALDCSESAENTGIVLPVGVATDSLGNVYVANQGVAGLAPSIVTIYAAGAFGCVNPIGAVGRGTLAQAEYVDVDTAGNVWVSDLAQNAIFEFDSELGPDGLPLTSIIGKKPHLKSPMGIAISPSAAEAGVTSIYVANNGLGEVDLFENVEDGGLLNIRRTVALKGKRTKLNLPVGLATPPVVPD